MGLNWTGTIVPCSDDEPNTRKKLFGRNEATHVDLLGWTNTIPIRFIGAKADLTIKTLPADEITVRGLQWNRDGFFEWEHNRSPVMKLAELNDRGNVTHFKISQPLTVQVLEKKAVEVILKGNEIILMGKLLVGDETGFCLLTTFNDNIEYLYNQVEIGDRLVLIGGSMKKSDYECEANFLNPEKFLKGELKIGNYETRRIYRLAQGKPKVIFNDILPSKVLWQPSHLQREESGEFFFPEDSHCINICGVVSYVGRISRVEIYRQPDEELTNSSVILPREKLQYICYRWIQLVDSDVKKPISIKLIISNLTWHEQKKLLPGTAIVLTNLKRDEVQSFLEFHLISSCYTRMYVNKDIFDSYVRLLPLKIPLKILRRIANFDAKKIFTRQDIEWMVGGNIPLPIANDERFRQFYTEEVIKLKEKHPSQTTLKPGENFPIARREEQRIYIRGYVYQIFFIQKGKFPISVYWTLNKDDFQELEKWNAETEPFTTSMSGINEVNWICFRRQFPLVRTGSLSCVDEVMAAYEENMKHSELYQCLLLPSVSDSSTKFKELPIAEEDKYFLVYILDPEKNERYACWWNTFPFDTMKIRLQQVITRVTDQLNKFKATSIGEDQDRLRTKRDLDESLLFIIDCHRIENPTFEGLPHRIREDFWDIRLIDFVEYDRE